MLQAGVLFVAAASAAGFIFADKCYLWRYGLSRDEGQRIYLRSIAFGIPFLLLSFLISDFPFWITRLASLPIVWVIPKEHTPIYSALAAPILAYVTALAINKLLPKGVLLSVFQNAMQSDDFDAILWESMSSFKPVAVSLENRKVYVGFVADGLEPSTNGNSYLTILPFLSGFRSEDNMQFIISAVYEPVLQALEDLEDPSSELEVEKNLKHIELLKSYYMAFPRPKIVSLHLFNDHLYRSVNMQYKAPRKKRSTGRSRRPSSRIN